MVYDERDICGAGIASTGDDDPFVPACSWHDLQYRRKENKKTQLSRREVDNHFLKQMLEIANGSWRLKAKAYLYYSVARLFGGPLWKW